MPGGSTTRKPISEDPIGLDGGINPYAYAGNGPLSGRDPFGLQGGQDELVFECSETDRGWVCVPEGQAAYQLAEVVVVPPSFDRSGGTSARFRWGMERQSPDDFVAPYLTGGLVPMRRYNVGGGYEFLEDPGRKGGLGRHYQVYHRGTRLDGIIDPKTGKILPHAGRQPNIPRSAWRRVGKFVGKFGKASGWALGFLFWLVAPEELR